MDSPAPEKNMRVLCIETDVERMRKCFNKHKEINLLWMTPRLNMIKVGGTYIWPEAGLSFLLVLHNGNKTLLIDTVDKFRALTQILPSKFIKGCVCTVFNKKYKLNKGEYYS